MMVIVDTFILVFLPHLLWTFSSSCPSEDFPSRGEILFGFQLISTAVDGRTNPSAITIYRLNQVSFLILVGAKICWAYLKIP